MKMQPYRLIAMMLIALVASADAQEPSEAPVAENSPTGHFLASTLSTFAVERTVRNPFSPIGYVKPEGDQPALEAELPPVLPDSALRVTSILMGDLPLAVINGREYARGEAVPVTIGTQQIDVLVLEIGDGYVLAGVRGRPPQRIEISR